MKVNESISRNGSQTHTVKLSNFMKLPRSKQNESTESFHQVLKPVYLLAQCFGIFPLYGILNPDSANVRFKWLSSRTIYSLSVFISSSAVAIMAFNHFREAGVSTTTAGDVVFYFCNSLILISFVKLARSWHLTLMEWKIIETDEICSQQPLRLSNKILILTVFIVTISLFEHLTSYLSNAFLASLCESHGIDGSKAYFKNAYKFVFAHTKYRLWKGLLIAIIHLANVIAWNFMDLFVIVNSWCLATKFNQFNQMVQDSYQMKHSNYPTFWRSYRESYNKLYVLTKFMDVQLSPIVLLSLSNNLMFICIQLLNSLRPIYSIYQQVYFYTSFGYLMLRTLAVCLFASSVNEASRKCLPALYNVPSESYNTEVERLTTQITSEEIALTGYQFFSLTRRLFLTIAGTIVTYEIVLVQFNSLTTKDSTSMNITILCDNNV